MSVAWVSEQVSLEMLLERQETTVCLGPTSIKPSEMGDWGQISFPREPIRETEGNYPNRRVFFEIL